MTTGREFYSYGSIRFTKEQVKLLLQQLPRLREGYWLPEYIETGYSGGKGKPQRHSAYFEKAVQVAADIDTRIEACGEDGLLLELFYSQEKTDIYHFARALRLDFRTTDRRIGDALRYICGKCPRWVECPGVGECSECQGCPRFRDKDGNVKCKKRSRQGRIYQEFKSHKKGRSQDNP